MRRGQSVGLALGVVLGVWGAAQGASAQYEGQAQPVYGQPVPGQPVYGQPVPGQPVYAQPVYGQPVYGQPAYGQPMYQQCVAHAQCGPGMACVSGVCASRGQIQYRERPITGLIVAGAVVLPVSWGLNIVFSSLGAFALGLSGNPNAGDIFGWSLAPIIGPFVQMAITSDPGWHAFWGLMGGLQTLGLTMIILGAVLRTREPVIALGEGRSLAILPTASPDHGGLSATLTF